MSDEQNVKEPVAVEEVKPPVAGEPDVVKSEVPPVVEPVKEEEPAPRILEKEVTLPDGKKLLIKKLKAGHYYAAQKYYAEWLASIQKVISEFSSLSRVRANPEEFRNEDGTPNTAKIAEEIKNRKEDRDSVKMFENLSDALIVRNKFIAAGLEMTLEEFSDKYYPEELDDISEAVVLVNNFMDNLKKSVSHMGGATM